MTKRFCNALAAAPQLSVKAGDETLVQLVPPGDWPQWDEKGKRFEQKCDEKTFQTLLENFSGEVLVDADHASEREGARDTKAYAWIQALSVDDSGALCGAFRWTDIGAEAVSNRRYRFVSVCWACEEEGKGELRPVKLVSVALTNTPNIPAKPILNQQESAGGASADPQETPDMEELKTLLGLPPEAGEAEIVAAVKALREQVAAANEEKEEAEAESFAEENKDKVKDAAALAAAYRKDKALAREMVANFAAPAPAKAAKAAEVETAATRLLQNRAPVGPGAGLTREQAREKLASLPHAEQAAFYREHAALIDG